VIETPQLAKKDILEVFGFHVDTEATSWLGKPKLVIYYEDFKGIVDSINICYFSTIWASIQQPRPIGYDDIRSLLEYTLGTSFSVGALQQIGSRIHHVEKALNIRNGFRASDDDLPSRFFKPAPKNPEGPFLDRQGFLDARSEYYQLRNWDPMTGIPSPETFYSEELPEIAKYFEKHPVQ
jgi:aldehyde:ferredoxin oxidoreductase